MPREQTEAIVLRTFNVGEQDKIVTFFSRDKGIIRGIAKGARKFGNRFGSCLEPLSQVILYYYEKERKELVTLSNCDLIESYFDIQKEHKTAFTLGYFAELAEEFSPSRAKDDALFRLLVSVLQALKKGEDIDFLSRYFEAWLLKINGVLPDFSVCKKCGQDLIQPGWLSPKKDGVYCHRCTPQKKGKITPELNTFVRWIRKSPPSKKGRPPFSPQQLEAIKKVFKEIILYHLEREPKTLRFLT